MGIGPSYKMVVDQSTGKQPDNDRCVNARGRGMCSCRHSHYSQQSVPVHFGKMVPLFHCRKGETRGDGIHTADSVRPAGILPTLSPCFSVCSDLDWIARPPREGEPRNPPLYEKGLVAGDGPILGKGAYGVTRLSKSSYTGEYYAVRAGGGNEKGLAELTGQTMNENIMAMLQMLHAAASYAYREQHLRTGVYCTVHQR